MNAHRFAATAVAAGATVLLLAGCQSPVVTMVTPPGWGNETPPADASAGPTIDEVRFAAVPSLCGAPGGPLEDGALSPAPESLAIGSGPIEPVATSIHIADDPGTGAPLIALAGHGQDAVGAAAIFACEIEGETQLDRVVVWDADMQPVDVINLAQLRGGGAVVGLAVTLDTDTARVEFQEVGNGTRDEPGGEHLRVPLTIDRGQLVVGALTVI